MKPILAVFSLVLIACSCGPIRNSTKYEFANGHYTSKIFSQQKERVYLVNDEDFVLIYPLKRFAKILIVDTSKNSRVALPQLFTDTEQKHYAFHKRSFDVDFLTIPFKYRPPIKSVPRQFNANLNGGVYLGYRNDSYVVRYNKDPLGNYARQTTHFGISMGGFVGLGGTAMNPWVSNDQIQLEYDGLVWTKGIACIIGLDKITIGLSMGWDHLLDQNKQLWIYQAKPWIGLVFGLNLN